MAAVSRSCLHICQEVTVQEKMGSPVCWFSISSFSKPACVGDGWLCSSLCSIIFAFKCSCSESILFDFSDGWMLLCDRPYLERCVQGVISSGVFVLTRVAEI